MKRKALSLLCWFGLWPLTSVHAEPFLTSHLKVDGSVSFVTPVCLQGAIGTQSVRGARDLLVIYKSGIHPNYRAHLALFRDLSGSPNLSQGTKNPVQQPLWAPLLSLDWSPQRQPLAIDIAGRCSGTSDSQSIILLYTDYAEIYRGRPTPNHPIEKRTIKNIPATVLRSAPGELTRLHLTDDWSGDGTLDLIVPTSRGLYMIHQLGSPSSRRYLLSYPYKNYIRAPSPIVQSVEFLYTARMTRWLPLIEQCYLGKDTQRDLCLLWQDETTIFEQQDGRFDRKPPHTVQFDVLSEKDRHQGNAYAITRAFQLNSDSRSDFIINRVSGSVAALETTTTIHLSGRDSPIQIVSPKNKAASAVLTDVNNDGRLDLVMPTMNTGIMSAAKILITGSISTNFMFHLGQSDGSFSRRPSFEKKLSFEFDIKNFRPRGFLPTLEGDFSGDGLPDAIYGKDSRRLNVVVQKPRTFFANSRSLSMKANVSTLYAIADLNFDDLSDILFWYPDWEQRGKILIMLNTGEFRRLHSPT